MTGRGLAAAAVVAAAVVAVVAGLRVLGPPSDARARRLDDRREADLAQLARDVDVFWARRGMLPTSLEDLAAEGGLGIRRTDPDSSTSYGYHVINGTHFELCAEFAAATAEAPVQRLEQFWVHGRGRQCFPVEVRTDIDEPPGR